jgi:hypothetical protein
MLSLSTTPRTWVPSGVCVDRIDPRKRDETSQLAGQTVVVDHVMLTDFVFAAWQEPGLFTDEASAGFRSPR